MSTSRRELSPMLPMKAASPTAATARTAGAEHGLRLAHAGQRGSVPTTAHAMPGARTSAGAGHPGTRNKKIFTGVLTTASPQISYDLNFSAPAHRPRRGPRRCSGFQRLLGPLVAMTGSRWCPGRPNQPHQSSAPAVARLRRSRRHLRHAFPPDRSASDVRSVLAESVFVGGGRVE